MDFNLLFATIYGFEICVKEKAEHNQANNATIDALAGHLGIPKKKLRMIKGHRNRNKIFEVL